MSRKGKPKYKIVIGTPSGGNPTMEFTQSLFASAYHPMVVDFMTNVGSRIAHNRNNIVRAFLRTDADALLFVDDDMLWKNRAIDKMIEHFDPKKRPVIGGLCFGLDSGLIFTTLHREDPNDEGRYIRLGGFPQDDILEVDATGGAFILVARHILEELEPLRPGYQWFAEEVVNKHECGEDIIFCRRVKELGYPIHIATGARITHIKDHVGVGAEHYVHQINKSKYVFTGAGDGLYYLAGLMQAMNLPTGYESVFTPELAGPAKWGAWRGDASRYAVSHLKNFKGDVFHVVAHPLDSISAMMADGVDVMAAASHWIEQNLAIEPYAHYQIPVEGITADTLNMIGWELGTPRSRARLDGALERIPRPTYERTVTWKDLGDYELAAKGIAKRYGYHRE